MKTLHELLKELTDAQQAAIKLDEQKPWGGGPVQLVKHSERLAVHQKVKDAWKALYDLADAQEGISRVVVKNAQQREVLRAETNMSTTAQELVDAVKCSSEIVAQELVDEVSYAIVEFMLDAQGIRTNTEQVIKLSKGYTVSKA